MSFTKNIVAGVYIDQNSFDYAEGLKFLIDHAGYTKNSNDIFYKTKSQFIEDTIKELNSIDLDIAFLKKESEIYTEIGENKDFITYLNRLNTLRNQRRLEKRNLKEKKESYDLSYIRGQREHSDWLSETNEQTFLELSKLKRTQSNLEDKMNDLTEILQKVEKIDRDFEIIGAKLDNSWCPVLKAMEHLKAMGNLFFISESIF